MVKDFETVFELLGPYVVMWAVALFVFVFLASRFLPGMLRGFVSAGALLYAADFSQSLGSEYEIDLFASFVPLVLLGLAVPFLFWGTVDVVKTLMTTFKPPDLPPTLQPCHAHGGIALKLPRFRRGPAPAPA